MQPIDLIQQAATVDIAELLDQLLRQGGVGPSNTFSRPPDFAAGAPVQFVADSLDSFVNSPSPLPGDAPAGPTHDFSTPAPLQPRGELVPNGNGGSTFIRAPQPEQDSVDPLAALAAAAGRGLAGSTTPGITGAVDNPVDAFGSANPDRVRELLRKLLDET